MMNFVLVLLITVSTGTTFLYKPQGDNYMPYSTCRVEQQKEILNPTFKEKEIINLKGEQVIIDHVSVLCVDKEWVKDKK